ncbi:single-stranded-DNA-specific exonuclease RecJ [Sulfurimonas sp.]|uniref:single-stranded-DNA-specific exonuclease RecJ n=1 Tax=Sulfurimonas sp. TaxID=2022749 RepID=UPI0025DB15E8|nr:single-stranded-DNA-specific exonuclease RecJ [Sulfurimonas sp.]MDD5157697.1 single-stranded-DNA-specific exonuclease RecJ [Sulfurimonas sp.]
MENAPLLTKQTLFELLSKRFGDGDKKLSQIPDPNLLQDATKSAKKIAEAIKERKKIVLVGDYDVDGVSSSAIMVDFFRQIPYPLEVIIPNRFRDGYGVSPNLLERIDANLIITVDNGITAVEAANICKQRGIELIITDHHTPSDLLPDAYAIIDPKLPNCDYPFKEICGAQVAWLLLGLLKKELNLNIDMRLFLDILCVAIIADIMPLVDINRILVKEGLKLLMHSNRPSSIIIRDFLNKSVISSEDIGFQIAPRINSAGRLEDASIALEFLTAKTVEKAFVQFEILNSLNELRKENESATTKEALLCVNENDSVIVVAGDNWHEGVVGIVASRVVNQFEKPAIVLSCKDGVAKGSARSVGEVDIYKLIKANESYLTKFGGHKMAAGLGLEVKNIDEFRVAINKSALSLDKKDFIPKEKFIGIVSSDEIDIEFLELLESFEPYGEANLRPLFLVKEAEIISINSMGRDRSHSKITIRQFSHERKTLELILFYQLLEMPENRKLTCSYRVTKNEYNGAVSPQLIINKIYNY